MINLRIFNYRYLKKIIERFLNYSELCRRGPNYTPKMVKKAAERSLIKFFFVTTGQTNPPLFPWDACGTPTVKIRFSCTQNCKASQ